ncbi:MAG: UDP-2,4-diacetamido-2,4,6-trideoxy-beta-L-altropyranose hydrolase [Lachnospiraceae bacterium]|nr:UDP-2,4-diacetamido-2,4,6-trideoxy-beta-L-altropyranose hydrolase [Lachnospiraceae bacterium]
MFWIRADGNEQMGAGHLMRCLTIAYELIKITGDRGDVAFICADEASAGLVRNNGYEAAVLGTDYRHMASEFPEIYENISPENKNTNVILIDSYFVTDEYLQKMRTLGKTVLIDDLQERAFPVDAVVNYNAFADTAVYEELYQGTGTKLFVGDKYIPIREQFAVCDYLVRDRVEDVLITTGGGDYDNAAGKILAGLNGCSDMEDICENTRKLNYHLIIGRFNPYFLKMERLSEKYPWIHVHANVEDMAAMMKRCDVAITAGGTTVYELAAVGVPFICFSYAANQNLLTEYMDKKGIAGYGGRYYENAKEVIKNIENLFNTVTGDVNVRNMCYLKERGLVDGKGAKRLAEGIYGLV